MENIGVEEVKTPLKKEERVKKGITAQVRLIIMGLVLSTIFIVAVAFFCHSKH